jgi:hypothetical protein
MLASSARLHDTVGSQVITDGLFHPIYVVQEKWFRGLTVSFRSRSSDETIGGA